MAPGATHALAANETHPAAHSLYTFDAAQVAWLETRMWEAYYARQDVRLFLLLVRLVGSQFGVPWREATRIAVMLARPAMQFARMAPPPDSPHAHDPITHDAAAYAFVIPDLTAAYEAMRAANSAHYDAETVARAELHWWIVHRHPTRFGADALTEAIAALYAAEYVTDSARVREAARLRAQAALVCDAGRNSGQGGRVRGAPYWQEVYALLGQSYRSLRAAVADLAPPAPALSRVESASHYHFVTTWIVHAPIEAVWAVIADARTYLDWWSDVYLGVTIDAKTDAAHLHTKGALPYHLHWTITPVTVDAPHRLVSRGSGDFDGVAQWLLHERADGGTELTLDWELNAEKPLLKLLSPIAKPLFAWNHRWAMDKAIAGLEPYLHAHPAAAT